MQVEIWDIEEGKTGSCCAFTLRCGNEFVRCDDVVAVEEEEDYLRDTFEDWKDCALRAEEGYDYWVEA